MNRDIDEIIESVDRGKKLCGDLKRKFYEDSCMYTVFLFSEDEAINRYTVYYLPVHAMKNKVTNYLVVSFVDGMEERLVEQMKVPYRYVSCSRQEAHDIGRYCTEADARKRADEHLIINGTDDPEEYRYRSVLGINGISEADVVALCVFDFKYVPDEIEVRRALGSLRSDIRYRKIDWNKAEALIPAVSDVQTSFPEVVYEEVDRLVYNGNIDLRDRLVLFSDTRSTRAILDHLGGYRIEAILDNDESKAGTDINGIVIYTTEVFFREHREESFKILVPTRSYMPICEQLYYYGYKLGVDVFVTYRRVHVQANQIEVWRNALPDGKELYDSIRQEYPGERIYMCTYEGTGDIFLIGMYLKDRMLHDGVKSCVLVVASNASRKLLEAFELVDSVRKIYVLNGRTECNKLLYYTRGLGYGEANAAVLNNDYGVLVLKYLSGIHGIDFNTLFQRIIFFSENRRISAALTQRSSESIFRENNLRVGRTVLLSPYANTTHGITDDAWIKLARDLTEEGYDVCTNVSGKDEKEIEGTRAVFIPYSMLIDFLDRAGGFVGLRSGLCDIVSGSKAKKIVLYPEKSMFQTSTYYNYFSLEKMFDIKDSLTEFVVGDSETDISEKVIAGLKGGVGLG